MWPVDGEWIDGGEAVETNTLTYRHGQVDWSNSEVWIAECRLKRGGDHDCGVCGCGGYGDQIR